MSAGDRGPAARNERDQLRHVQGAVWRRLCFHVDGLSTLSTWALLHRHGLLDRLRSPGARVDELVAHMLDTGQTRVNAGCVPLALRALHNQGWLKHDEASPGERRHHLSAEGETWHAVAKASRHAPLLLAATAEAWLVAEQADDHDGPFVRALALAERGYDLPPTAPERWRHHLDGPLAAAVLTALCAHGWPLDASGLDQRGSRFSMVGRWLTRQGWTDDGGNATAAGAVAALLVSQYWYPLSYLETLRNLDVLWFGDPNALTARADDGGERHVDRALDIRFSGRVFEGPVRQPFLDQVLPLFNQEPQEQPRVLVDVGAGDGTMLRDTWRAVMATAGGGPSLGRQPLLAVAVEPSAVARRASAATLTEADVPHQVIEGDIGAPASLARALERLGIEPSDCLFVGKSVIHNRAHQPPGGPSDHTLSHRTGGVFIDADGAPLSGHEVERSLVALFRSWKPWLRRHGLIANEAHIAPAGRAAELQGRSPLAALELLHGYSQQLLVEPEVHRAAAHAAGLHSVNAACLGEDTMGYVTMTVDHWRAEG